MDKIRVKQLVELLSEFNDATSTKADLSKEWIVNQQEQDAIEIVLLTLEDIVG